MGQWVGAQRRPKVTKISKTCPYCDVTSRKPPPKTKNVFFMSARRLAESVEGLNSSLALAAGNLWPKKGRSIAAVKGLRYQSSDMRRAFSITFMFPSSLMTILPLAFCESFINNQTRSLHDEVLYFFISFKYHIW